ncbi:MAG TPA: CheR family methyltransferase [Myxococcota bacterium]|nr:CheR family methyltransferase [Myxococcota bacterium]HRY95217.1 CheR family methyltransferase [Myxococcota bacterium]HSA22337.1 CheR family methyltransferase [Myxococcota bacterium]
MDQAVFRKLRRIAFEQAGIVLRPGKESLVEARVARRQRALGLRTHRAYLHYLEEDSSGEELIHFLDAISTNFSSFFRESDHFRHLEGRVGQWLQAGRSEFSLWSAAASSGEEAYSIAITLETLNQGRPFDYRLLATDLSTRVLEKADQGVYEAKALAPLSRQQRTRFFSRQRPSAGPETFRVRAALRERVAFARLNLAITPYPMRGPFDAIFCRNVMIYLDAQVRQRLVAECERLLNPGGVLFIGHAETLMGLKTKLRMVCPSVHEKA